MIYPDTHIAAWLYAGLQEQFPPEVVLILNKNQLLISPIVRLELQYPYEIKRIRVTPDHMLADLNHRTGLSICDKVFSNIITRAMTLDWTRDPFDRLITAHASLHDNMLLTRDRSILANYQYAVWE